MTTQLAVHTDIPRGKRSEGQWALDGREPLNGDEIIKQEDPGRAVKKRIIDYYSREGFDSIVPDDLAPCMKWCGIYTQRRQDLGGEMTNKLDNAQLQDKYFMMRVRFDGGQITPEQLRVVGGVSRDFGRGTADFTDRQNVQIHWIEIENVPEIWRRLDAVGLSTLLGCGDVPRVILGSPVAGVAADEIIDATPAIERIKKQYLPSPEFHNLPRKFKSAISGNSRQDSTHEIQDLAFVGVNHPDHGPGFDVWVGGGLSTKPMIARRLGVWVPLEEVPEVWANTVRIFRDYGYRRLRNRARLKFLIASWGVERFRAVLEEYMGHPLIDGVAPPIVTGNRDHIGVHKQKDGRYYVGVKPTVGPASGDQLIRIADVAEKYSVTRIRSTTSKELLFLDVSGDDVAALQSDLEALGLYPRPSEFRRGIISCTGLEFCKLALTTTKARAIELVGEREQRVGDLDVPITISLNGCPNSCARTQVSDIDQKGQIVEGEEGFQVHLGGALGVQDPDFGRKLRGLKVKSRDLGDYVVQLVEKLKDQREPGEQFRHWVLRAEESDLPWQ
ncbi:nitrite/sulfite reductase [Corynebacterium pyruviciproducens]